MQTLVLSQSYAPIRVVSWQKAVTMFFDGKVEVVSEYEEDIRSVSITIKVPAVVRLVRPHKWFYAGPRFSRANVLIRDEFTCQYCGAKPKLQKQLNFDHVMPRARGGRTCWENIVTACIACNTKKACRTPEEASMKLRKRPTRPKSLPAMHTRLRIGGDVHSLWESWVYWNGTLAEGMR